MTFNEAKNKLDQITTIEFDLYNKLLSNLYKKISKKDLKTAEAIELASMAMMLYCKK